MNQLSNANRSRLSDPHGGYFVEIPRHVKPAFQRMCIQSVLADSGSREASVCGG
jgi:hypothetical protein